MSPLKLYGNPLSGHTHRVQLLLSLLNLPFDFIEIDLKEKEQKSPEHLARHPFGQVPVLEDGETSLWDSNAILVYLASKYDPKLQWFPSDALKAAQVQQWFCVAAGALTNGPAVARRVKLMNLPLNIEKEIEIAEKLFRVLDSQLEGKAFLVEGTPTLADISMYSYVAHADEGGIDMTPYRHIADWLKRIENLHGFIPMKRLGG